MESMSKTQDLVSATSIGDYSAVDRILSNNLEDVNAVNKSGWTALMYAANYGHFNIIRLLVRHNVNVNFQDSIGRTALMMAACNGHTRCIDALINYGNADKELSDVSGANALIYAVNNGHGSNKLIKSLLTDGNLSPLTTYEGQQVRGRSQAQQSRTRQQEMASAAISSANSVVRESKDHIFNPYEKTPFSNANWPSVDSVESNLNPKAEQFVPSNAWSRSTTSGSSSMSSTVSSTRSSGQSMSSVISPPPNFKRKLIGKRHNTTRKAQKSPLVKISAPIPKTLFHALTRIDLIQYLDVFENNGIDFKQFLTLTDTDFESLGIQCYGHRKKLAIAQQRYHESLDINSTNETFLADFLLNERVVLNEKIQNLEEKLKELENQ